MWNFIVSWFSFWIPVSAVCWVLYGLLYLLIVLSRDDRQETGEIEQGRHSQGICI